MSDDELQAEVLDELRSEPATRWSRIYVRARDGTVTLCGQVGSLAEKQRIDRAVARIAGIQALDTQISVRRFASSAVAVDVPGSGGVTSSGSLRRDPSHRVDGS